MRDAQRPKKVGCLAAIPLCEHGRNRPCRNLYPSISANPFRYRGPPSVRIMSSKPSFPANAGPRGPATFSCTRALHPRSWKEPMQSSETKLAKRVAFLDGPVELFPAAAAKQEHAPE